MAFDDQRFEIGPGGIYCGSISGTARPNDHNILHCGNLVLFGTWNFQCSMGTVGAALGGGMKDYLNAETARRREQGKAATFGSHGCRSRHCRSNRRGEWG